MAGEYIAAVAADTHLDRHNWSSRPDLQGDSWFSFQQIVDFADENNLPLLLAGDVFDKNYPDAATVHFAVNQLRRLRNVGFIEGQHEKQKQVPWLSLVGPSAQHLHQKTWDLGVRIYGLSFVPAGRLKEELAKIPSGTQALLAHQVWQEFMSDFCGAEASFKDVPHVSQILTGDFHKHCVINVTAADGRNIEVASPGSSNLRAIDESADKYFFAWKSDLTFVSVKLKTRHVHRLRVVSPDVFEADLVKLKKQVVPDTTLPTEIQKPILHVEFYDNTPEVVSRVTKAVGANAFLFFKPLTATLKPAEQDRQAGESYASGLAGHLHLAAPQDSPEFQTAMRLLKANDRKAEYAAVIQESLDAKGPL